MSIKVRCECGARLKAADRFAERTAECPACLRTLSIPVKNEPDNSSTDTSIDSDTPAEPGAPNPATATAAKRDHEEKTQSTLDVSITEFLDPPNPRAVQMPELAAKTSQPVLQRMFEAMLDPRSIQWMLILGGSLAVLGLLIWLVSEGVFQHPIVIAALMGVGTISTIGSGWFLTLKSKYKSAGQAVTFLGCVVAPLNLWFYHAQNLFTIGGHLWVGALICCLIYFATVYVLRNAHFMYALEIGITLTALLLLADLQKINDITMLSLFAISIGLISLHAERIFDPHSEHFPRMRFGMPLFWSGHLQLAAGLILLLCSQLFHWLAVPIQQMMVYSSPWAGNPLSQNHLLACGIWLAGLYAYLYSELVVKRTRWLVFLAGFCLVMAQITFLMGSNLPVEVLIVLLTVGSVLLNVIWQRLHQVHEHINHALPTVAIVLAVLPMLLGLSLHIRISMGYELTEGAYWQIEYEWLFVVAMVVIAAGNRISSWIFEQSKAWFAAAYLFLSASGLMIAAVALLRAMDWVQWTHRAPVVLVIPIFYLIGSRFWRGKPAERPLYWVAQTATAVIFYHMLCYHGYAGTRVSFFDVTPQDTDALLLSLVFLEATLFYTLAALFQRRSNNVYLAAVALCAAMWQLLGYAGLPDVYYARVYIGVGVILLGLSRWLGLEKKQVYSAAGEVKLVTRGLGLPAAQSGHAILLITLLPTFLSGLFQLATQHAVWDNISTCIFAIVASLIAAQLAIQVGWKRFYMTIAIAIGSLTILTLLNLIQLSAWQKIELFSILAGMSLLVFATIGLFRENQEQPDELVSCGLLVGSLLATVPLLLSVLHNHYWSVLHNDNWNNVEQLTDKQNYLQLVENFTLLTIAILLLATGLVWKLRATTIVGGFALLIYLFAIIIRIAYQPQVAVGVYLAVGGVLIFGFGVLMSMYRDQLLQLPDQIANREGMFRILNWR